MKHIAHKKLAVLLRIALMIAALVCGAIFFWFLPQLGRGIALADPEYAWAFWPCLIFAWLFAVPVFWAMAALWAVFSRIGRTALAAPQMNEAKRNHTIDSVAAAWMNNPKAIAKMMNERAIVFL